MHIHKEKKAVKNFRKAAEEFKKTCDTLDSLNLISFINLGSLISTDKISKWFYLYPLRVYKKVGEDPFTQIY